MNVSRKLRIWLGWCPNEGITNQKTRLLEYEAAQMDAGISVKKWKFDLLFTGHICALLFMSLYTLPGGMIQASDIYSDPNLMQRNHGLFLADVTISIASVLFSAATIILMYNIIVFKKLYSKLCFINMILLSGLFVSIIVEASFLGDYHLEWSIYWASIVALLPSIPSFMSIKLDKISVGQKLTMDGISLAEIIRRTMGWCPNAVMLNKKEELNMVSYGGKYVDRIKGIRFREILGILHLVFAAWLITTALLVLAKPLIFPWWTMDINIISSGILLAVGLTSLLIFFNFIKGANIHRMLALVNVGLLVGFFLYLSQFLISQEFVYSVFLDKPYNNYSFGFMSLLIFTLITGIPSILTFFSKAGEKRKGFLKVSFLVLLVVFASLGVYYLYLNQQKEALLVEEFGKSGEYKLYRFEPGISWGYPYFLDSQGDTTGHQISKDTYDAMQFLRNRETGKVLTWWDFELEIKAAGKEPVISYASKDIMLTIARPALLYDKYEPGEMVADVSRFFTTNSEDVAKSIAGKYRADTVYISRERMSSLFPVMLMAANPDFSFQSPDIQAPEAFDKRFYEPSMVYKFNNCAELKYFDKIFENKDVYIYQLKK